MPDRLARSIIALAVSIRLHKFLIRAKGDTANAMIFD